jgi:23S rRNA (uracil1939-C5)-methyltransferase
MPEPDFSPTKNINIKIGEFDYTFSAEVFFQTNYELLPALIDFAIGDAKGETALDLYCGVGLFTLPLAKRFRRVVGVESFPQSVLFARQSAVQMDNISFHCLSVSDWLKENVEKFDFVLLDPPRAGAESETIESVIRLRPKRISYVSCDPATLARDLRMLTDGGFVLEQIAGFDLFPQTHHVETVAKLSLVSV